MNFKANLPIPPANFKTMFDYSLIASDAYAQERKPPNVKPENEKQIQQKRYP